MYIRKPYIFMEKKASILLPMFLFIILSYGVVANEYQPAEPVLSYSLANQLIVIDPGHGGFDPGAWRGELMEKNITLSISKKLQQHLSQAGAIVVMLREEDKDLAGEQFKGSLKERKRQDLKARVDEANRLKADLYISIHTNADPSPRWFGAQTFYNARSEESKIMAECVQDELTRILGNTKRKAKPGSYYIIDKTKMPAVIVEVGFLSHPTEAKLLNDPAYQNKVAYAVFSGVVNYQASQMEPADKSDKKIVTGSDIAK